MAQQKNAGGSAAERFDAPKDKKGPRWKPWKQALAATTSGAAEQLELTEKIEAYFRAYLEEHGSPYDCDSNRELAEYFRRNDIDTRLIPAFQQLLPNMITKWEWENPDEE